VSNFILHILDGISAAAVSSL